MTEQSCISKMVDKYKTRVQNTCNYENNVQLQILKSAPCPLIDTECQKIDLHCKMTLKAYDELVVRAFIIAVNRKKSF